MKALYIPAALLALILAFSLWTGRYAEQQTEMWTELLEQADQAAEAEDWSAAEKRLQGAYHAWDGSQFFFHTVMDHAQLDEAEVLFSGAMAACRDRDDDDFHLTLAQLKSQLRLLAETQSISLKNIL